MALPRFISRLLPGIAREAEAKADTPQEEINNRARRFAGLLAFEIKLYNQAKINKGREHRDIYKRLEKDIERARSSYNKKYGQTAAAAGDYFNKEIIRVLADNNAALMGSEFLQ